MRVRPSKKLDISRLPGRSSATSKAEAEAESIAAGARSEMDI
jgi:hypothetical protein